MRYKTGSITYEFETKTFNYDRSIRLFADVMDMEEAGSLGLFPWRPMSFEACRGDVYLDEDARTVWSRSQFATSVQVRAFCARWIAGSSP